MVLWGCPPPRGYLPVPSVPPEEHTSNSQYHFEERLLDQAQAWAPYTPTTFFTEHTALSAEIGRPTVQALRCVYGILKMHKATVHMHRIAGNQMQAIDGPSEYGDPKKIPPGSLSALETAMGGILHMCMHNLENKDRACRQKGYKRYWVLTNIDGFAAFIKNHPGKLKGPSVFTRDFAPMYTSIPQEKLQERSKQAVCGVLLGTAKKKKQDRF